MKTTDKFLKNGDTILEPYGKVFYMTCCDCNLVHRVVFEKSRGKGALRIRRDNRMTNSRRLRKAKEIK